MNYDYLKTSKEEETYRRLTNLVACTIHEAGYTFGSAVQAEDILHDVIEDLKKSVTYEFDFKTGIIHGADDQKAFMITAVRNKCNAIYAKEKRRRQVEAKAKKTTSVRADDNSVMGELAKAVILRLIPEDSRRVLNLKRDGYKHQEISEQLNISVSASKKRYQRAKECVVAALSDEKQYLSGFYLQDSANTQKPAS